MKKLDKNSLALYAVTDRRWLNGRSLEEQVEVAIGAGVTFVQLREKEITKEEYITLGKALKDVTNRYQVPFVIDDDVEVALACDADGVHIGQSDMALLEARKLLGEDKIIGVSAQTVEQAVEAERNGADYLGVGAVFATGTKTDACDVSLAELTEICEAVSIPVIAIGGITEENIECLDETGIVGVAVVSAIFASDNIIGATQKLYKKVRKHLLEKKVLAIAGSDSSGGAGIQADLKTMEAHGVYGMSVITAVTAQNTREVSGIWDVPEACVAEQLDSVFTDIYPDAVKIGMIGSETIMRRIVKKLEQYRPRHVVIDPVMVSTSGSSLFDGDKENLFVSGLLTKAEVITPNIPEAEILCQMTIDSKMDMTKAAKMLEERTGAAVLIKGGHGADEADDVLCQKGKLTWFHSARVDNPNTHGTGCTLSSAIACYLAKGYSLTESVRQAKQYVTGAIENGMDLGSGRGPLNHHYLAK